MKIYRIIVLALFGLASLNACGGEGFFIQSGNNNAVAANDGPISALHTAPSYVVANGKELALEAAKRLEFISVSEYMDYAEKKEPHLLFDVREKGEFDKGHIEGAILLPRGVGEFKISKPKMWKKVSKRPLPTKKEAIVIYCKTGLRSNLIADNLQRMGFIDVRVITGGWVQYAKGKDDKGAQATPREHPPVKEIGTFSGLGTMVANAKARNNPISVAQVQQYKDKNPHAYIFDVRQRKEYAEGHIEGSLSIPRGVFEFFVSIPKKWKKVKTERPIPAKTDPILVICKKGSRSILAADALQQMGFTNVRFLSGGWLAYAAADPKAAAAQKGKKVAPVDDEGCGD